MPWLSREGEVQLEVTLTRKPLRRASEHGLEKPEGCAEEENIRPGAAII